MSLACRLALLVGAVGVAGCGSTKLVTKTVTVVQRADATPTAAPATTPVWRPVALRYRHCDANIRARAVTTSCGFAENAFYEYYVSAGARSLRVYSPATRRVFAMRCRRGSTVITCTTSGHGVVKFPQKAIDSYDDEQAATFAEAHEVGSSGGAAPSTGSSGGDSSSDDTNDDEGSSSVAEDSPGFCDTHDCIPNYPNGNGSTVQCSDGTYSHSGGIQGACSHHGGVG